MHCVILNTGNSVFDATRQVRFTIAIKEQEWQNSWELTSPKSRRYLIFIVAQVGRWGGHCAASLPSSWDVTAPCFLLYFIFMETSSCYIPLTSERIISFIAFSVLPCLVPKASLGKSEQKVAGTWPVCLPYWAPSQKESAPHWVPGIWWSVWKGSMAICLGLYRGSLSSLLSPVDLWVMDQLDWSKVPNCSPGNDKSMVNIKSNKTVKKRRPKEVSTCSSGPEPEHSHSSFSLTHTTDINKSQAQEGSGESWN